MTAGAAALHELRGGKVTSRGIEDAVLSLYWFVIMSEPERGAGSIWRCMTPATFYRDARHG